MALLSPIGTEQSLNQLDTQIPVSITKSAAAGGRSVASPIYAGFWRRVLASVIDGLLLSVLGAVVLAGLATVQPVDLSFITNASLVFGLVAWVYFAILESSPLRATVGKAGAGIYVGDVHGDPVSFTRASVRYWLKLLSTLPFGLGFLLAAVTPRKQALHDLMAGTLVLRHQTRLAVAAPSDGAAYWDGTRWTKDPIRTWRQ